MSVALAAPDLIRQEFGGGEIYMRESYTQSPRHDKMSYRRPKRPSSMTSRYPFLMFLMRVEHEDDESYPNGYFKVSPMESLTVTSAFPSSV